MLKNNLLAGLKIELPVLEKAMAQAEINPKARAEDLTLEQWQFLVAALSDFML